MKSAAAILILTLSTTLYADIQVAFTNSLTLPSQALNQSGQQVPVTGLTGLTMLADGRFAAVATDHLFFISPTYQPDGTLTGASVTAVSLSASNSFGDIAFNPLEPSVVSLVDTGANNALWRVTTANGTTTSGPAAPLIYATARADKGLSATCFSSDGQQLWIANREALNVDGPLATTSGGTRVRLTQFTRNGLGQYIPIGQKGYITQPLHGFSNPDAWSGLVALVALPDGRCIAAEQSRATSASGTYLSRFYAIDPAAGDDVSGQSTLFGTTWTSLTKTTLHAGNYNVLSGLALGPSVVGGRLMLGVTDSTAGPVGATSRLLSFVVAGLETGCGAADVGGQGGTIGADNSLDNNDFVAFIDLFFQQDNRADLGSQGGVLGADSQFDNNDFVAFIDRFFSGC